MMDLLRIVKLHAAEIIYDPEAAAEAVQRHVRAGKFRSFPQDAAIWGKASF